MKQLHAVRDLAASYAAGRLLVEPWEAEVESKKYRLRWWIKAICFVKLPHALSKLAHRAGVEDGCRNALLGKQSKGPLFLAASGFHGYQLDLMGEAKAGQRSDSLCCVGKLGVRAFPANARV